MESNKFLDVQTAARWLNISVPQIYRLFNARALPYYNLGKKTLRIFEQDLINYVLSRQVGGETSQGIKLINAVVAAGLTQRELALKLNLHEMYISLYVKSRFSFTEPQKDKIAELLSLPKRELFEDP